MFDPIYIYVPEVRQIIRISEGSGDNLNDEDIEAGFVDYIYYEQYVMDPYMRETDSGMFMLTEMFQEHYNDTTAAIPDVLEMAYNDNKLGFIVL